MLAAGACSSPVDVPPGGDKCKSTADCPGVQVCRDGKCVAESTKDGTAPQDGGRELPEVPAKERSPEQAREVWGYSASKER